MAFPYVPRWLDALGLDGAQIGLIVGAQPVLRWASAIVMSALADRRRIRAALILACGAGGVLAAFPLLVVRDVTALLAVFAVMAVLAGPLVPLLDAVVLDHLDRLGGDYGRLRVAGSIAFVVGAMGSAPLVARLGAGVVPWLLVAAQLGVVPALLGLPRAQAPHGHQPPRMRHLLGPAMRAFLAAAFLLQASAGAWVGFFAVHTAALGLPDWVPGATSGLAVIAEIALFTWGRGLLERWTPPALLYFTLGVTVVRWLAAAVVEREALVIAVQLGHAVTFSVFHLAAMRLLLPLVPAASRSSGQSLYGLMGFGLGGSCGMWLAGVLVDAIGTSHVFAVEAAVALAAFWPLRRLARLTAGVDWRTAVAPATAGR